MKLMCIPMLAFIVSAGCISPVVLADKAGYLSGVGYLLVNDPPREEVSKVKSVILKIDKAVEKLKPGDTLAMLYPDIAAEVGAEFIGVTKTLALSVTRLVLDGIDMFLLTSPDVADKKDLVVQVTQAFTRGARTAFDQFAVDAAMRVKLASVRSASVKAYSTARNNN